jgi:hypothetical protein
MAHLTNEQIAGRSPVQIAFIVDNLEEAALHWAGTFGAGPFFVLRELPVSDVRGADGEPTIFEQGIALGVLTGDVGRGRVTTGSDRRVL